jgi:integrase
MGSSRAGLVANENYRFGKCIVRKNSGSAEVKDLNGRVIIRLPRNWFDGKQKSLPLGIPTTLENMAHGGKIAAQINSDYLAGQFDRTLAKYKQQPQAHQQPAEILTIKELWGKYCDYKQRRWKALSAHYNRVTIGGWIDKIPQDWRKALEVRSYLLEETTEGITVRVLCSIESCLEWAMRVGELPEQRNPYKRMGSDLQTKKLSVANALTKEEQSQVIKAFYDHPTWAYYAQFVEFLFLTGCRPSEAIGLDWSQMTADFTQITFDRSVVRIGRKWHQNKLSKTNRARIFYCNGKLQHLLTEIHTGSKGKGAVFLLNGEYIDYGVFSKRPWKTITFPILDRSSTPYSTRDTFITRQTEAGKPIAIVAKWVDNSTGMIEKKYLDTTVTQAIRPD